MHELRIQSGDHDEPVEVVAVYEHMEDASDEEERLVGRIEIDSHGYFTIADAQPGHHEVLQHTLEILNRKDAITLVEDEPAAQPLTTQFVTIARGEPGFIAGMRRYVTMYYGFRFG